MMLKQFLENYWRYYLILEEQFCNVTKYVELNSDNYSTYSIEFVHQMQTICSEVDVIMKVMSGYGSTERKNIADYASVLLANYVDIVSWEVKARDISLKPFEGWNASNASNSLIWWDAYNSVKHGRDGNFKKASLENTLKSLMGLYLLEMLYFKKLADNEGKPDVLYENSKLFSIVGWQSSYTAMNRQALRMDDEGCLHIDEITV